MIVGVRDCDGECGAKTHAVFGALDPNPVVAIAVHGGPSCGPRLLITPYKSLPPIVKWHTDGSPRVCFFSADTIPSCARSAMRTGGSAFGNFGMIAMGVFNRTAMLCSSFIVSTMSG